VSPPRGLDGQAGEVRGVERVRRHATPLRAPARLQEGGLGGGAGAVEVLLLWRTRRRWRRRRRRIPVLRSTSTSRSRSRKRRRRRTWAYLPSSSEAPRGSRIIRYL